MAKSMACGCAAPERARSRRSVLAFGGESLVFGLLAGLAASTPTRAMTLDHPPTGPAGVRPAAGTGLCNRCASEIAAGQRSADAQCFAFNGAYDGAMTCQTCSHSWADHR